MTNPQSIAEWRANCITLGVAPYFVASIDPRFSFCTTCCMSERDCSGLPCGTLEIAKLMPRDFALSFRCYYVDERELLDLLSAPTPPQAEDVTLNDDAL